MQNNKSPGNDRLTKEFYETFWNERKRKKEAEYFSQRQAVIKLIEKKGRDKRL